MALAYADVRVSQYEVDLKNKPQDMIKASPKGTVPVLIIKEGHVIDESLEIIMWALKQSDPDGWLQPELKKSCDQLIRINDNQFKILLDNYKYPQKSEKKDPIYYRDKATIYLEQLDAMLTKHRYLLSDHISYSDIAIFPFIRQFCMVDQKWFEHSQYKHLNKWLNYFLNSIIFQKVMEKII
jgi:glutathione S-transferase